MIFVFQLKEICLLLQNNSFKIQLENTENIVYRTDGGNSILNHADS
jgi:hypothetical protein